MIKTKQIHSSVYEEIYWMTILAKPTGGGRKMSKIGISWEKKCNNQVAAKYDRKPHKDMI